MPSLKVAAQEDVTICDIPMISSRVSRNMKSSGDRSIKGSLRGSPEAFCPRFWISGHNASQRGAVNNRNHVTSKLACPMQTIKHNQPFSDPASGSDKERPPLATPSGGSHFFACYSLNEIVSSITPYHPQAGGLISSGPLARGDFFGKRELYCRRVLDAEDPLRKAPVYHRCGKAGRIQMQSWC